MAGNSFQSPVSGESSIGTAHSTSDANRSATAVVNTSTNTAGTWSAAVTMTGSPVGAKAAWCMVRILKSAATPLVAVEAATGYTLSDVSVGTNYLKYAYARSQVAGATGDAYLRIRLDASGQFKWCTDISSSTTVIGSAIHYEM